VYVSENFAPPVPPSTGIFGKVFRSKFFCNFKRSGNFTNVGHIFDRPLILSSHIYAYMVWTSYTQICLVFENTFPTARNVELVYQFVFYIMEYSPNTCIKYFENNERYSIIFQTGLFRVLVIRQATLPNVRKI
jgi:hypothetical protein